MMMSDQTEPLSLLTRSQVEQRCAIGRTTLFRLLATDSFPKPVYVTASTLKGARWRTDDIQQWIDSRPRSAEPVGA